MLGADRPAWATGFGRLPDHPRARISALSEHHATVSFPEGAALPELGRSFGSHLTMSALQSTSPMYSWSLLVERSWTNGGSRPAARTPRLRAA